MFAVGQWVKNCRTRSADAEDLASSWEGAAEVLSSAKRAGGNERRTLTFELDLQRFPEPAELDF